MRAVRLAQVGLVCVLAVAAIVLCGVFEGGVFEGVLRSRADITFCETAGPAAGECNTPTAVGVDWETGAVYAADDGNNRIDVFAPSGGFERAFGWDVIPSGQPGDTGTGFEVCTSASTCQKGILGTGAGQLNHPTAIAVDNDLSSSSFHDVYVVESASNRVQKFEPNGTFLRAWGRGVIESGATGTGDVTPGSTTIANVKTSAKAFAVGQTISGEFIPAETRIVKVEAGKIVLSNAASGTKVGDELSVAEGTGNVAGNEQQTVTLGTGGTFTLTFTTPNPSNSNAATTSIPAAASAAEVQAKLQALANVGAGNVEVTGASGGPWTVEFKGTRFADTNVNQMSSNVANVATTREGEALEVCTPANAAFCKAGSRGASEGQLEGANAKVAVGPGGNVFVADKSHVQKFDPEGALSTVCPPVNGVNSVGVAVDSGGAFYAAGANEVRKYDSACNLLDTVDPSPANSNINTIAVDDADNLFVADNTETTTAVYEYDSSGTLFHVLYGNSTLKSRPLSLAPYSDGTGDLFAVESSSPRRLAHVKIEPPGPVVLPFETQAEPIGNLTATLNTRVNPEGKATTVHFQYVDDASYDSEGGFASPHTKTTPESASVGSDFKAQKASSALICPDPEKELPEGKCLTASTEYHLRTVATNADAPGGINGRETTFKTLPPIQLGPIWSTGVGTDSARLHAELNPTGIAAEAHFEYIDDAAYQKDIGEGGDGFTEAAQSPLLDFGAGTSRLSKSALVYPLEPGTTYHYRYIAHDFFDDFTGPERTFSTAPLNPAPKTCSNQAFRVGSAANLPDCRAYELVSPLEKEGGDIVPLRENNISALANPFARIDQATPDGEALTYASYRGFGEVGSVPFSSQYVARRDSKTGWSTGSVTPPREGPSMLQAAGAVTESLFRAFTEDLCGEWFFQDTDLALVPGAPAGVPNLYRRDNCGEEEGSYELLTSVQPPGFGKEAEVQSRYFATLGGFSGDGTVAAFYAPAALTAEASTVAVGEELTCTTTAATGDEVKYQWLRNGVAIGPAKKEEEKGNLYKTAVADQGKAIQCQVFVTNGTPAGATQAANPAQVVAPFPATAPPLAPVLIPAPSSSAPLTVGGGGGQTLSCDARETSWEGSPPSFSYKWYRNGAPISGTASTYLTTGPDLATPAAFQCVVTATNAGGSVSKASEVLKTEPEPLITIEPGTPNEKQVPATPNPDPRVLDVYRVYLQREGALHLVSMLPGGRSAPTHSSVGTAQFLASKRIFDSVDDAVSADGSRVFWSAQVKAPSDPLHGDAVPDAGGPSKLYLRLNPAQEQSAFANGSATGSGNLSSGSNLVTSLTKATGVFQVGQTIAGDGIPFGTTIAAVSASTLTLSANATKTATAVVLEAFSECTEAENACTIPISSGAAIFRGANPTGTKALFSEGEDLFEVDVDGGIRTLIAGEVKGLLGTSEDTARVYLVSGEDKDGPGPATAGKFNLYLHEAGGGFSFIATLLDDGWASSMRPEDHASSDVRSISRFPINRSSRVSADGMHAAFMSDSLALAEATAGYENTDALNGEADAEVYLYDAEEEELRCISCNPSGARPQGHSLLNEGGPGEKAWTAAWIPGWETQWHASRVLSTDGRRLFFMSFEGLVSRDTNGHQDVYEWERADSKEECEKEFGAELFSPDAGGCLSLISSGKSAGDSEFIDASQSGSDVFFTTGSSLLPQDYGLIDVYDAREKGGFPLPPEPKPSCEGEACQSPPPPPDDPTPASSSFEGQGNVATEKPKKPRKHKKHKRHRQHKRNHHRGAGR